MSMEDLKALTECAECTWDYIDRLRMALASACKERDEVRKELHEAKSELDELRKTFDMFGGYDGIQNAFSERDAAVSDLESVGICDFCVHWISAGTQSICCKKGKCEFKWRGHKKEA